MRDSLRQAVLKTAARGAHWTGALRVMQSVSEHFEIANSGATVLRRPRQPKFAILCYHRVGSGGVPFYSSLDPSVFEAQMRFLRRAYRIVSMDELCRELDAGGPPGQSIAITFDDGYRDLYATALPILRQYGIPATIHLTAAAIESGEVPWFDRIFVIALFSQFDELEVEGTRFRLGSRASRLQAATHIVSLLRTYSNQARIAACAQLEKAARLREGAAEPTKDRMLSWQQIRKMQKFGISFGAHTMTHPVVSRLDESERQQELSDSKRLLENRLQTPIEHFAFPFGSPADIDAKSCAVLSRFGYRSAASTVWGVNTSETNRYLLRRIGGDESCLPLFSLRLRWLFTKEQPVPESLRLLEQAAPCLKPIKSTGCVAGAELEPEVERA